MEFISFLWTVAASVAAFAAGAAYGVLGMSPARYGDARILFWSAGISVAAMAILFGLTVPVSVVGRIVGTALIGATSAVIVVEATRWVAALEKAADVRAMPTPMPTGALFYQEKQLRFHNYSPYDMLLWANKLGDVSEKFENMPRVISVGHYYYLLTDKLEERAKKLLGENGEDLVPFEMYLSRRSDSAEFTAKFFIKIVMKSGQMDLHVQQLGIVEGGWPDVANR